MLQISNLHVKVDDNQVLSGVDLEVKTGELLVLFGPNGCGKTSLLKSIMGLSKYKAIDGDIKFEGESVLSKTIDERNKLGISLMYQKPPVVTGVKMEEITKRDRNLEKRLSVEQFLQRNLNDGLSGGEIKRSEMYQMISMNLKLYMLDEPDSGVDVENIKVLAGEINKLLKDKTKSVILVTHGGEILKYLKTDKAIVMLGGKVICHGDVERIYDAIKKVGYKKCVGCKCHGGVCDK